METTISLDEVRHMTNNTTNFDMRDSNNFSTKGTKSRSKKEVPILMKIEVNPIIYLLARILIVNASAILKK